MSLSKTMVITGASSGIGEALARQAAKTYRLLLVARRAERLQSLCTEIRGENGEAEALALDVTATTAAATIVETALRSYGRIDVIVNNAGRADFGPLLEQSDDAVEMQFRLNVIAPLQLSRAALPLLQATRGQLAFVGSGVARVPLPNYGAYAPAKAAVRAAAINLRRELRDDGIAVTYVDPGVVKTEFHLASNMQRNPLVPLATPERIAGAILRGIERRAAVVNAQPWQTAFTTVTEWCGTLADALVISRFAAKRHTA